MSRPPIVGSRLPVPANVTELATDERRAFVWLLHSTGHTQVEIAETCGVSRTTIAKDLRAEAASRRSLRASVEEELEHIVGQLEAIAACAWRSYRHVTDQDVRSLAGSNYLRLVMDTVKEIAHIRGLDQVVPKGDDGGPARAEIVVKIGGRDEEIQIGARAVSR